VVFSDCSVFSVGTNLPGGPVDEDADRFWERQAITLPVEDLMRQCNGKAPPSKALVKGLAKELEIDESFLNRLAEEVRKDLG
jgi:hypothetical protein